MSSKRHPARFESADEVLAALSAVSHEPICLMSFRRDADGRLDFVCDWLNAACAELLGNSRDDLLGKSHLEVFPNGGALYDLLCKAVATGADQHGEIDVSPGITDVTRIFYRVVHTGSGLALSITDYSEVRKAEERASSLEQLLISEVELSNLGGAILRPRIDADGKIPDFDLEYVNEHGRRLMNMHSPVKGHSLHQLFGESEALTRLIENLAEAVASRSQQVFEIQIGDDGTTAIWMRFLVVPLGDIVLVHGDDVSTQRAAEHALAESELRYRSLFQTANEGIAIVDIAGRVIAANEAFAWGTGFTAEELKGMLILDLVSAIDREKINEEIDDTNREQNQRRRLRLVRKDGSTRWISASTVAMRDAKGVVNGYLVMALDIDSQVQSELALQASEARYRAIVEHADVLIALTDAEGTVVFVNKLVEHATGYTNDQLIGKPSVSFYVPAERHHFEIGFSRLKSGSCAVIESRNTLLHAHGYGIPTLGSAVALRDEKGVFSGVVIVGKDMSEVIDQENARIDLAAALAVAELNERERLAEDLHDGPVQTLAALSLRLGAALREDTLDRRVLLHAEATVAATIAELRLLLFQLTPPDLQAERLGQCLFDRGRKLLGPSVEVILYDQIRSQVDIGATQILFRIAQEALSNAAKHANATTLTISLSETKNDLIVEIDDDGVGGDQTSFGKSPAGHLGIRSMVERARSLGGRCEIMSTPGHGTSVFIRIPRNAMVPTESYYS